MSNQCALHKADHRPIPKTQRRALSALRHSLRRLLRFSEDAAREAGITLLQYQEPLLELAEAMEAARRGTGKLAVD